MKQNFLINGTLSVILTSAVFLFSCKKDVVDPGPPPKPTPNSKMTINFSHSVNGVLIRPDSVDFTNLSGNEYGISSVQYLVSDIRLDDFDGNFREINQYQLIDFADQSTWKFVVKDSVKKASIKSISYYIGFLDEENVNNGDYPDLDAANWAFPPLINSLQAGGYYAFKMSGRYIPLGATDPVPFNIQVGSKRMVVNGSNTSFEPNPIIGSLRNSDFELDSTRVEVNVRVNLAKVFENNGGNLLDLNIYDSNFESDPEASKIVSQNIANMFTIGDILQGSEIVD